MGMFNTSKKKEELFALTRNVLIEKWVEHGRDVIPSMVSLIRNKIAPALKLEMKLAGFDIVILTDCPRNGNREIWSYSGDHFVHNLSRSDLCMGGEDSPITNFERFCLWATRAEKMLDKIHELQNESAEMKKTRDRLRDRIGSEIRSKK